MWLLNRNFHNHSITYWTIFQEDSQLIQNSFSLNLDGLEIRSWSELGDTSPCPPWYRYWLKESYLCILIEYNLYHRRALPRMRSIQSSSQSSIWRATCSFPSYKADIYRDYIRTQQSELNIMEYSGGGICHKVEHINIRGHMGFNITVPFWQHPAEPFHIDTIPHRYHST